MSHVPFTAPISGGDSKKVENVEKIPTGMHLCIISGIYDIGTQSTKFGEKRICVISYEFPQILRVFYEGEEARPKMLSNRYTFSMAESANLRKDLQMILGRQLSDTEAMSFDISSVVGMPALANIVHSPCGKYENIMNFMPATDQTAVMYNANNVQELRAMKVNDLKFFAQSMGFNSQNFGNCPKWIRTLNIDSAEGKAWAASGQTFAEPEKKAKKKCIMKDPTQDIKLYLAKGWTEETLVAQGYAYWQEPQQAVSQPAGMNPAAPVAAAKKLVMTCTEFTRDQYHASNWTDDMIVQNGKGYWDVSSAPAAPKAPVAPVAPTPPQPQVAATPTAPPQPQVAPAHAAAVVNQQQFTPKPLAQAVSQPAVPVQAPTTPSAPSAPVAPATPAPPAANTTSGYPTTPLNNTDDDDLPF